MRINHNISALTALHELNKSNSKLEKSLERLSSGLRINRAADDAAGLAITQKMDAQIKGLDQANQNALDGISLIQTAEGSLNEVHSMLQRIRELSVQASNDTYDSKDREAIQDEVDELISEIQRISKDSEFNELNLLDGSIDRTAFSTDSDIADVISMSDTVDAGEYTFEVSQAATKTTGTGGAITLFDANGESTTSGSFTINGEKVEIEVGDTAEEVYSKIREAGSAVNVSVAVSPSSPIENGKALTMEAYKYGPVGLNVSGDLSLLSGLGLDLSAFTVTDGVDVEVDTSSLVFDNPATQEVEGFPPGTTVKTYGNVIVFESNDNFELKVEAGDSTGLVTLDLLETGPLKLQIGASEGQTMEIRIQNMSAEALDIDGLNLATVSGAADAINILDAAITTVSTVRSKLGAYQNRLEYTISNLETAGENLTSSMSRIQDADMAYEMTQYTQQNIIQQAGTSMLAQANQRPQSLLQLLQG